MVAAGLQVKTQGYNNMQSFWAYLNADTPRCRYIKLIAMGKLMVLREGRRGRGGGEINKTQWRELSILASIYRKSITPTIYRPCERSLDSSFMILFLPAVLCIVIHKMAHIRRCSTHAHCVFFCRFFGGNFSTLYMQFWYSQKSVFSKFLHPR